MSDKKGFIKHIFGKKKKTDGGTSVGSSSNSSRAQSPVRPDPTVVAPTPLITAPSKTQRAREAAINLLDFTIIFSEATDLLKPVKAVCGILKKVLEVAKKIEEVDEDWKALIERINIHILTIESQTKSLEEDEKVDQSPPPLNPDIEKPLQGYISTLKTVCEQLNEEYEKWHQEEMDGVTRMKRVVDADHNKGIIVQITRNLDDAFQRYSTALEYFVAKKVDQIQQELAQFRLEFKHEVKVSHLDRLKESGVYGNQHRTCLEGTRVNTLDTIRRWANDKNTTDRVFCLLDGAGMGKSTVAKHMVDEWKRQEWLIGRFFFSRDTTETMSARLFCSKVSNSFAALSENFKANAAKFEARADWKDLSLEEQFEGLVAGPLRALNRRAILTIDALDECENRRELLETIRNKQASIPLLRILVTGRPEADIKKWAGTVDGLRVTSFRELEGYNRDVDIYIETRLQEMSRIQGRVKRRADGLFIWARIACDLLLDTDDVANLMNELEGGTEGDSTLDHIYMLALQRATPMDSKGRSVPGTMIKVLQMLLATREPLSIVDLQKLSTWNGDDVVERVVTRLGSLLLYQSRDDPIRLLHTTIREFLTVRERAGIYYVQVELGHCTLTSGCLNILLDQSSWNTADGEEPKISEASKSAGKRVFEYASDSWAHHYTKSCRKLAMHQTILNFAEANLKIWISQVGKRGSWRIQRCLGDVLLITPQNIVLEIAMVLLDQSLEQIDQEIVKANNETEELKAKAASEKAKAAEAHDAYAKKAEAKALAAYYAAAEEALKYEYDADAWEELKEQFEARKKELEDQEMEISMP